MNIISKKEAEEKGSIFYYTGKPCKHGHLSERLVKGGSCRQCRIEVSAKLRNSNREEYNKYCREKKKEHYSKEKRRTNYVNKRNSEMFYAAKNRAKKHKISFTITLDDIIIPDVCPVFNVPLNMNDRLFAPSLDRIDNNLGYVKGNVKVISAKANRLKNNGTVDELKKIIEYMESNGK